MNAGAAGHECARGRKLARYLLIVRTLRQDDVEIFPIPHARSSEYPSVPPSSRLPHPPRNQPPFSFPLMNTPVHGAVRRVATAAAALFVGILCLAPSPSTAQVPRITEFMPDNQNGITDEDGTPQGWIEVWNPSPSATTNLSTYRLTDGVVTWAFPAASLLPDDRILVWASGKDRRVITAPLHTSFTLPPGGGTLKLVNSTGTVLSDFSNYPEPGTDVSWGRDETDTAVIPALTGAYTVPTPGERNNHEGSTVAQPVVFSHASQAFTTSLSVTLSADPPDPDAVIRYTTNRAIPTAASQIYTGPLNVTATTAIRARVFRTGLLPGPAETQAYLRLSATTQTFTSAMPVVVVSNFLTSAPPESKAEQPGYLWAWEPAPGSTVNLLDPPTYVSRVQLSRRGSSTLTNAKYNLDMETRNAWNEDENEFPLLGMPAHSDWVLSGPFDFDRSLIHNPFIYSLSRTINRYAPRHRMAEVFLEVNGGQLTFTGSNSTANDYYGVYNILEKIRRNAERMDISKLDPYDNSDSAKTGGYIWKVDRADADEAFSAGGVPGSGVGMAYYYPKGPEMKSPQRDPQEQYLTKYLNDFRTALAAGNKDPVTGWPAYLDQTATIDHHLLNVWALCTDALRLSAYWQKDRGAKFSAGPIWDFDRAFSSTDGRSDAWVTRVLANQANGTWRSPLADYGTDWFNTSSDATGVQTPIWWHLLFRDPDFYQNYIDRWQRLRRGPFAEAAVNTLIDSINADISSEAVTRDVARWGRTKRQWRSPFTNVISPATQAAEIIRLKDFMKLRANFMDSQWVGPVTSSATGGQTAPGTEVTLTGPANTVIYYSLDGTDPRPAGGAQPGLPGVMTYSAPITVNSTTRLRARAYKATHTALSGLNSPAAGLNNPPLVSKWGGLTDLRFSTDPPASAGSLMITEINFHPSDPTPAERALNPAWTDNDFEFIELRNRGAAPVDLSGASFSAGVEFTIPAEAEITLAPGEFVVVVSNPAAFAARYGAAIRVTGPWTSGNLSNGGEKLTLDGVNGLPVVTLTYADAWSPAADGDGHTLVIYDQDAPVYGVQSNWRTSRDPLGSPGAPDPPGVSAGPDAAGPFSTPLALAGTLTGSKPASEPAVAWSQTQGAGTAVFTTPDSLNTTVSFSAPGVYTLRLTGTGGGAPVTDEVTVYAGDTTAAWLSRNPAIGALTDDFDADGRTNLLEYALVTDPAAKTPGEPPVAAVEGGFLTLTFTRARPPADVAITLQVAVDTADFRDAVEGEFTEKVVSSEGLHQTVKFTDSVPLSAGGRRYLRLKVTQR